ncbi:MAG: M50 family peptidase [Candidatus Viridilinea halotolerans]|uniref:M50 family peptidase n=1 Tax=Candidatus Viridilinea halotolerans TaxID=2491704 RepID=A0A426U6L2_9CHLR|nr:MAG: M50 family peptidase [Candidatus Viridilinea halotolerans]
MLDTLIATWRRPDILLVAVGALASTLLWRVPLLGLLFYPFRLLNTFVHEVSHGLAALLTGGSFERFVVYANMEGLALIRGGSRVIVASAGYLGTALFGGLLILLTATPLAEQTLLLALGASLGLLCLMFVRNLFGWLAGMLLAASLGASGWLLSDQHAALLVALLALQMPLAAIHSLVDLLRLAVRRARPGRVSDAHLLARHTGIPAIIWASLWFISALAILFVTVGLAYAQVPLW